MPNGGNYKTARPLPVKTTGVLGAGTMGSGIALSLITSGFPCVLVEQNEEVNLCFEHIRPVNSLPHMVQT